ncbi:hypothetical protein BH11ACT4_BH11ACT4_23900 [soil metagenome]
MSIAEQHNVPAAWYPDQNVPGQLRWWDGHDWTADVRPLESAAKPAPAAEAPLLETRHGLHAVAKPAQGFGHATPEELRAWPPPHSSQRSDVDVPVREMPREWSTNESVGTIKGWLGKSDEPAAPALAAPRAVDTPGYATQPADYFIEASSAADFPVADNPVADNYVDLNEWQPALPGRAVDPLASPQPSASPVERPPVTLVEQPVYRGLSAVPNLPVAAHRPAPQGAVALTRRQLRELVGPLTTGVEAE